MPRGDLVYQEQLNHGRREKYGMPPSRNTVYVQSNISEAELKENFEKAGCKESRVFNNYECTCEFSEGALEGNTYIYRTACKLHGPAEKKKIKITEIVKKFSDRQIKKAREFVLYGNSDIREVMHRNG